VSTINLVLSLDRNTKLQSEVITVKRSYDRLARHVQMRQLFRGIVAMANGYQHKDSSINKDSFSAYLEKYREHIGEIKKVHDQIDKDQFEYSEKFKEMLTEKRVSLEYLDQHDKPTFDNHTYSFALNLYIQRAMQVSNWPIQRFKGKIRIMNIDIPPSDYMPTEDERLVYFLNRGGQGILRGFGKTISN
jgi:mRNA-degrading endonuclease HigB of HigAB toxin-antitoxin module